MGAGAPRVPGPLAGSHPAVRSRRTYEALSAAAIALVPLVLGLAITASNPNPNPLMLVGAAVGVVGFVYLLTSTRYEVTVTLVVLYLGLLDGPIKLEAANRLSAGVRDVLIIAVVLGMLMRIVVRRERLTLPPLSRWVVAFVAFVLIEAANPHTANATKVLGGYRQQLEWVPFFFFGYMLLRSKERLRKAYVLLGVIALLNGVAGAIESRLSPSTIASWGPGYHELAYGGEGASHITGRTYAVEGVGHIRPPALGSDAGFGGAMGTIALPMLLALLATGGPARRKWLVVLLCAGAVLGIATSASRTATVIGVLSLFAFGGVALAARLRLSRTLLGVGATAVLVVVVGSLLTAYSGSAVLARQESLTNLSYTEQNGGNGKTEALSEMPHYLIAAPFGYGLGIAGAAAGFGGAAPAKLEGKLVTGGSAYELEMKEVGAPGVVLWVGLTINALVLAFAGLRRIPDLELRTLLVGLVASFLTITLEGLSGPTLAVTTGAFLWFAPGVIAYWFGRRGQGSVPSTAAVAA